jgi:hypothetical protein
MAPPTDDPLAAAESLESAMADLTREVSALRTYGERNRHMIWGLVAAIVIALASAGFALAASLQAREATSQARRNQETAKITCETGNEGRALQTRLWTYVLDASEKNPNLTAQQKKQIAAFRGYIATVYAPRDCNNLPTIPPGTVTPTR